MVQSVAHWATVMHPLVGFGSGDAPELPSHTEQARVRALVAAFASQEVGRRMQEWDVDNDPSVDPNNMLYQANVSRPRAPGAPVRFAVYPPLRIWWSGEFALPIHLCGCLPLGFQG